MTNYLDADMRDDTTEACLPDQPGQTDSRSLDAAIAPLDPVERLRLLKRRINGTLVFTTSFGLEDQALTHLIAESGITVRYVTLDTGRLFPETYGVWSATEQFYGIRIHAYYPNAAALEALVDSQGIDGFYASQAARKSCCGVRKVEPLERALRGAAGWITGLRADQSTWRQDMSFVDYEPAYGVLKANPLLDWSRDRVVALVAAEHIPHSPLHERGFLSIGCAPCTRAVRPDESERAGRWWWETEEPKECGLHLTADGRLVRTSVAS